MKEKLKNIVFDSKVTCLDLQPQPVLTAKQKAFINKESDSLNKIDTKWADKPIQRMYYYRRPTPIDVLNEERDQIFNNSYNSKEIYE